MERGDSGRFRTAFAQLSRAGTAVPPGKGMQSQAARAIYLVQQNWVNVTSDLAGYHGPQILEHDSLRILVKNGPRLADPFEGDYQTLL